MEILLVSTLVACLPVMTFSNNSSTVAKDNAQKLHGESLNSSRSNERSVSFKEYSTQKSGKVNISECTSSQDTAFNYFNCVTQMDNFITQNKEKQLINSSLFTSIKSKEFPYNGLGNKPLLSDSNVARKMRMCKDSSCIRVVSNLLVKNRNSIMNKTKYNTIPNFLNEVTGDNIRKDYINKDLNYKLEENSDIFNHEILENPFTSNKSESKLNNYIIHNSTENSKIGDVSLYNRQQSQDIWNDNSVHGINIEENNSLTDHKYTKRRISTNANFSRYINNEAVSNYSEPHSIYNLKHDVQRENVTQNVQKIKSLLKTSVSKKDDTSLDDIALSAPFVLSPPNKPNSSCSIENCTGADTIEINFPHKNVPEEEKLKDITNELNEISNSDEETLLQSLNNTRAGMDGNSVGQFSGTESAEKWNIFATEHIEESIDSVSTNTSNPPQTTKSIVEEDILNIFQFYERFGSEFLIEDNETADTDDDDIYKENEREEWWDNSDALARSSLEGAFVSATSAALFFTLPFGFNCSQVSLFVKEINREDDEMGSEWPCEQLAAPEDFLFFAGGLRPRTAYRVLVYESAEGGPRKDVHDARTRQPEDRPVPFALGMMDEYTDAALLLAFTQSTCSKTPPRPKTVWDAGGGPGWVEGRARMPYAPVDAAGVGAVGEGSGAYRSACASGPRALLGLRLRPVASPRPRGFPRHLDLGHVALALTRSKAAMSAGTKPSSGSRATVVARPDHPCAVAHKEPDLFCILIMSGVQEDEVYSFAVSTIRLLEVEYEDEDATESDEDATESDEDKDERYDKINWEKEIKEMTYNTQSLSDSRQKIIESRAKYTSEKATHQQTNNEANMIGERDEKFQSWEFNKDQNAQHREIKNAKMRSKMQIKESVFEENKTLRNEKLRKRKSFNTPLNTDGQEEVARTHRHTSILKENKRGRGLNKTKSIENRKTSEREETLSLPGQRRRTRGRRHESSPVFVALRAQPCDPVVRGSCNTPGEAPGPPSTDTSASEESAAQEIAECPGATGDDALAAALLALTFVVLAVGAPIAYILGRRAGSRDDKLRWLHRGKKNYVHKLKHTDNEVRAVAASTSTAVVGATPSHTVTPHPPPRKDPMRVKTDKRRPVRFTSPVTGGLPARQDALSSSNESFLTVTTGPLTNPPPPPPSQPPSSSLSHTSTRLSTNWRRNRPEGRLPLTNISDKRKY